MQISFRMCRLNTLLSAWLDLKLSLKSVAFAIAIISLFAAILTTGNVRSEGVVFRSLFYGPILPCILTSPFSPSGWSYFEGEYGIFIFASAFSLFHLLAIFLPIFLPNKWFSYVVSAVSLIAWPIVGAILILWAMPVQGV